MSTEPEYCQFCKREVGYACRSLRDSKNCEQETYVEEEEEDEPFSDENY